MYPKKAKKLRFTEPPDQEDIYSIFRTQLIKIDLDFKIPVGVYVISRLFERPCFRRELKLIGITQKHLDQYLEKPGMVCEAPDSHLKKPEPISQKLKSLPMTLHMKSGKTKKRSPGLQTKCLQG